MKKLIFLSFTFLPITLFAQTDYYRYNSSTGTSQKIGYSEPSNSRSNFAPYVGISQSTLELYSKIGMQKQQNYDQSIQSIQSSINRVGKLVKKLELINRYKANQYSVDIASVINDLNQGNYDIGKPSVSNSLLNWFSQIEDNIINDIAE